MPGNEPLIAELMATDAFIDRALRAFDDATGRMNAQAIAEATEAMAADAEPDAADRALVFAEAREAATKRARTELIGELFDKGREIHITPASLFAALGSPDTLPASLLHDLKVADLVVRAGLETAAGLWEQRLDRLRELLTERGTDAEKAGLADELAHYRQAARDARPALHRQLWQAALGCIALDPVEA